MLEAIHTKDNGDRGLPDDMAGRRTASSKPSRTGQLQIDPAAAHPAFHGDGRTAPYKVLVQTSNIGGMGTDSAMFIRLFGCKGDFTEQLVDSSAQVFEPGKQVTSTFSGPDVGEIQRIQIYSSNGEFRSTCHLSHIDVFSSIMNEVFHFPIDDWIDNYYSVEHYYWRDGVEDMDAAALVEYHVVVYTSDIRWASTDVHVSIELSGSNGFVGKMRVIATAYNLQNKHAVLFVMKGTDVGGLERIVIHHNKDGSGPTWHCHQVEVYNPSTQRKYTFSGSYSCNTRMDRTHDAGGSRLSKGARLELVFGVEQGQSPVLTFHLSKHAPDFKHMAMASVDQEKSRQSMKRENFSYQEGLQEALLISATSPPASEERDNQFAGNQPCADLASPPPLYKERTGKPADIKLPADLAASPPASEERTGQLAGNQAPAGSLFASDERTEQTFYNQPPTDLEALPPEFAERTGQSAGDKASAASSPPACEERTEQLFDHQRPTALATSGPALEERTEHPGDNQPLAGAAPSAPEEETRRPADGQPPEGIECGRPSGLPYEASSGPETSKRAPGRNYVTRKGRILSNHELLQTFERLAITNVDPSPSNEDPRKHKRYKEIPRVERGHPILNSPYLSTGRKQSRRCQTPMSARKPATSPRVPLEPRPSSCPGQLQSDPATPPPASEKSVSLQSDADQLPAGHGTTSYKVMVQISDAQQADTDTTISIRLFGSAEQGGPVERLLDSSTNVLEPGKLITFMFLGPDVGEVKRMQIYSSGSGSGSSWLLSHIDVFSSDMSKMLHFPINKWVKDNRSLEYFFWRDGMEEVDAAALVEYHITVYTSDKRLAGADVSISVELLGSKGAVGQTRVIKTAYNLECSHAALFVVKGSNIGDLERIFIHQNNSEAGPNWHCQLVEVYDPANQRKYTFSGSYPSNSWQGKTKTSGVERVQSPGLPTLWSASGDVNKRTSVQFFKTPKGRITSNLEVSQTFERLTSAKRSDRCPGCATPIVVGQVQLIILPSGRECWIPVKKVDPKDKEESLCGLYYKGMESKKQMKVQLEEKYHLRPPKEPPKPVWILPSSGIWTCAPAGHAPSQTPRASVSGAPAQEQHYQVFLSFRVAEANEQALALKKALEAHGFPTFCSAMDLEAGTEWVRDIANALKTCKLVVIFATRTYGGKGTDVFGTGEEMNMALRNKKRLYVIPMSNQWTEPMTELILGERQTGMKWTTAPETVPPDLLSNVLRTCKKLQMQKQAPSGDRSKLT